MSGIIKKFLDIDYEKYVDKNLGAVIGDHLEEIRRLGVNTALVQICNSFLYGSFIIPDAIGFSTPMEMIGKGGHVSFCYDSEKPTNYLKKRYDEWASIYRSTPFRKDRVVKYTRDMGECSICMEDYELGDELMGVHGCDHKFHSKCLNEWRLSGKSNMDIITAKIMEERITFRCPLCQCGRD